MLARLEATIAIHTGVKNDSATNLALAFNYLWLAF